ncbi:MAG TPA: glycosyltransferase [Acidimicrobiia bacterium]|nr:glycosyltransferase [Acidimicrobiia bacterium]
MSEVTRAGEWLILSYFIVVHMTYLGLNVVAYVTLTRSTLRRFGETVPVDPAFLPPVTVIIPAHNEERSIAESVRSIQQLTYPNFEIVVVNDGSDDGTMDALSEAFDLEEYPEAYRDRIPGARVRRFLVSRGNPDLRVVDKENGGKADAVNAGINVARSPLFCTIDADSVLQRDSIQRVVRPFVEDARVIASGGTIRIANGCEIREGFLERVALPRRQPLVLFQIVEYLRAFLFGRVGWATFNGLLVLSGAFGMFRREVVVAAGGYRTDTLGEDMELVVRLHRLMYKERRRYRIAYVPDPICFTEAPTSVRMLGRQRIRWQRGLAESLRFNRGLLFHGFAGWVSYPFSLLFELYGSFIEVFGYLLAVAAFATGTVSLPAFVAFLFVSFGLGLAFSTSALVLEELASHVYPRQRDLLILMGAAIAENFVYRQLNAWWRLVGLARHLRGTPATWGVLERQGMGEGAAAYTPGP